MNGLLPRARKSGLIIEEVDGEMLVYDLSDHRAHCLNRCAAEVWRAADGTTTVRQMAGRLRDLGLPHDEAVVWMALHRLDKVGLLEGEDEGFTTAGRPVTRKEVLHVLGRAAGIALLLPAVTSVTAPLAAQAASCVTKAQCRGMRPPNCTGLPICGSRGQCCQERVRRRRSQCRPQAC
jgi:hypothetical protein